MSKKQVSEQSDWTKMAPTNEKICVNF